MTEQQQTQPFFHCNAPMLLSDRANHPRIPFHEIKTFTCSVCDASMIVTAPLSIQKREGRA